MSALVRRPLVDQEAGRDSTVGVSVSVQRTLMNRGEMMLCECNQWSHQVGGIEKELSWVVTQLY
jgi:hypothetical protein